MKAPNSTGLFVTGTDTGCGKTRVTVALLEALRRQGLRVAGMKPVASGATRIDGRWRNDDALQISAACSSQLPYEWINPWCFAEPVAPHLASQREDRQITLPPVLDAWHELAHRSQVVLIEGIGGWRVPLSTQLDLSALVKALDLPVLLVVGLRLGCINHARLTAEAVASDGHRLVGWIGNQIDPGFDELAGNMECLAELLPAPCLGLMPWQTPAKSAEAGQMVAAELLKVLVSKQFFNPAQLASGRQ